MATMPASDYGVASFLKFLATIPVQADGSTVTDERSSFLRFFDASVSNADNARTDNKSETIMRSLQSSPLFTAKIRQEYQSLLADGGTQPLFPQYGLLGLRQLTSDSLAPANSGELDTNLVFSNSQEPWSAFICGSQGSGKSHTLSCLLENSLLHQTPVTNLPNPAAAMVFHYDKFSSFGSSQICETAYLSSAGIKVRVLVAPSSYKKMTDVYTNLPGLPSGCPRPEVLPLFFKQDHLNIDTIMTLMAVHETTNSAPLYISSLRQLLRDMATENQDRAGVNYAEFRRRLSLLPLTRDQQGPLELRMQLLESMLVGRSRNVNSQSRVDDSWRFEKGTLTIVDLSDQFINENDACALFSICLKLFMDNRQMGARVIALDEAHKFLTQSCEAVKLTNDLVSIVRQQRHLGTRVIIATQEPTLSPTLLDLCNVSIVHRFNSPDWYNTIKSHLAGAHRAARQGEDLFHDIVSLSTGQALLFCPTAVLDVGVGTAGLSRLQDNVVKIQIRSRLTTDGGRSILSSDLTNAPITRTQFHLPDLQNLQISKPSASTQPASKPTATTKITRMDDSTDDDSSSDSASVSGDISVFSASTPSTRLKPAPHVPARSGKGSTTPAKTSSATIDALRLSRVQTLLKQCTRDELSKSQPNWNLGFLCQEVHSQLQKPNNWVGGSAIPKSKVKKLMTTKMVQQEIQIYCRLSGKKPPPHFLALNEWFKV